MRTSVIVGNPKRASRTLQAATIVATRLTGVAPVVTIDLVTLGADLLTPGAESVRRATETILGTDLVVVASPTYKASFTGILKLFFDQLGPDSLAGIVAVPLMLGGDWRHRLAPEVFLKPVLSELGASTPTRALFLLDSEYEESDHLTEWLRLAKHHLRLPE